MLTQKSKQNHKKFDAYLVPAGSLPASDVFLLETILPCLMQEVNSLFIDGNRLLVCPKKDGSGEFEKEGPLQDFPIILAHSYLPVVLQDSHVMFL